jgi:hypothetical protein
MCRLEYRRRYVIFLTETLGCESFPTNRVAAVLQGITLFIKLSLSVCPKPYLHMVKLRSMTKARQISAIQRHAQINHSLAFRGVVRRIQKRGPTAADPRP